MSKSGLDKLIEQVIAEKGTFKLPQDLEPPLSQISVPDAKKIFNTDDLKKVMWPKHAKLLKIEPIRGLSVDPDKTLNIADLKFLKKPTGDVYRSAKGAGAQWNKNVLRAYIMFDNYDDPKIKAYLEGELDDIKKDDSKKAAYSAFINQIRNAPGEVRKAFIIPRDQQPIERGKPLEPETYSDPALSARGAGDLKPRMLASEISMFDNFFKNTGTDSQAAGISDMVNRIKALTNFSKEVSGATVSEDTEEPSWKDKSNPQKFLNHVMILEYMSKLVREVDAQGGAYNFEAFLAFLAGGRQGGAESGAAGGMGEADFFLQNGMKGSAKYYAGKSIHQSAGNFQPLDPVLYVVGQKKTFGSKGLKTLGKSDLGSIVAVELSVFIVEKSADGTVFNVSTVNDFKPGGAGNLTTNLVPEKDGNLSLGAFIDKGMIGATLMLVGASDQSLKTQLDALNSTMDDKIRDAFEAFKEVMTHMKEAKTNISKYTNSGDAGDGEGAMNSLDNTQVGMTKLNTAFGWEESTPDIATDRTLTKIKSESLDNLIKSIIKKKLLK